MTRTAGGNITRTTYQDSAYWDYAYDGRDRLTSGTRKDSGGQTLASYAYTYDAGDNILTKVEAGTTTTFGYDSANELTTSTSGGTSTSYAYDAWGRMTSKAISGSYSATYAYRYSDKLYSVSSNFPNEGNVTYQYGGDGKRRERTANSTTTKYRWDRGWNMINEENSNGALAMTYVMDSARAQVATILADLSGTNPSSGTARYYNEDNIDSTRRLRASDKSSLGQYEYTPYGGTYSSSGASLSSLGGAFTGKPWDSTSQMYYFPYRYYSPDLARWLTRDPLGMVGGPNVYLYVQANPTDLSDALGADAFDPTPRVYPYPRPPKPTSWWGKLGKLFIPAACVTCALGLLGLEGIAYGVGVPMDDFMCSEMENNKPLRAACNACIGFIDWLTPSWLQELVGIDLDVMRGLELLMGLDCDCQ